MNCFTLSHHSLTCRRSPQLNSTAFDAQLPDLPPVPLMEMGFAVIGQLARHPRPHIRFWFIGSRLLLHASFRSRLAARGISVGIELWRAGCRWRVTKSALSIANWALISTMAAFPEAPL